MREGIRLDASIDPVCVATIGYGTLAYLDRRHVVKGDRIPQGAIYDSVKLVVYNLNLIESANLVSILLGSSIEERRQVSLSDLSLYRKSRLEWLIGW